MIFEASIEINRPIDEVFEVATCTRRCVVWMSPMSNVQMDRDEPTRVGATFSGDVHMFGQTYHINAVITEFKPPHRLAFKLIGTSAVTSYTFAPTEEGTTFRMALETTRVPTIKMFDDPSQLKAAIERRFQEDMTRLKMLLEDDVDLWTLTPA